MSRNLLLFNKLQKEGPQRKSLTTRGLRIIIYIMFWAGVASPKGSVNPLDLTNDAALGEGADAILLMLPAVFVSGEEVGFVNDRTRGHISVDSSILAFVNERVFFGWE